MPTGFPQANTEFLNLYFTDDRMLPSFFKKLRDIYHDGEKVKIALGFDGEFVDVVENLSLNNHHTEAQLHYSGYKKTPGDTAHDNEADIGDMFPELKKLFRKHAGSDLMSEDEKKLRSEPLLKAMYNAGIRASSSDITCLKRLCYEL